MEFQVRILKWVAISFSGHHPDLDQTRVSCVSCIRRWILYHYATREASLGGWNDNPLQYSSLGKAHGQRSLAGYSPWGCKESDTTELLRTQHTTPP